jgi:hypothetical protein
MKFPRHDNGTGLAPLKMPAPGSIQPTAEKRSSAMAIPHDPSDTHGLIAISKAMLVT